MSNSAISCQQCHSGALAATQFFDMGTTNRPYGLVSSAPYAVPAHRAVFNCCRHHPQAVRDCIRAAYLQLSHSRPIFTESNIILQHLVPSFTDATIGFSTLGEYKRKRCSPRTLYRSRQWDQATPPLLCATNAPLITTSSKSIQRLLNLTLQ